MLRATLSTALLLLQLLSTAWAQYCDPPCLNGGVCQDDGTCNCPTPSALEPAFFRGDWCETPAEMCADTQTFYCANNATCVEIVQGEVYECQNCSAPWGGDHCDVKGERCGSHFCFNGGQCTSFGSCSCPSEWKGKSDCSVRTDEVLPGNNGAPGTGSTFNVSILYYAIGGVAAFAVLVAVVAVVYLGLLRRRRRRFIEDPEQDDVIFLQNEENDARLELELPRNRSNSRRNYNGYGESRRDDDKGEEAILKAPAERRIEDDMED